MNGTTIALVKPANEPLYQWATWCDGLWGALKELSKEKNLTVQVFGYSDNPTTIEREGVTIYLRKDIKTLKYALSVQEPRVIFGWGTAFHGWDEITDSEAKKVLLFGGGPYDYQNAKKIFDHVVVENESDRGYFPGSTVAFGTNTEVFKPDQTFNKIIPSFYPAAFARWKRHGLWAISMPAGSVAIGQFQSHEKDCYEVCVERGHVVIPQVPQDVLPSFYNMSLGTCLTPEHMGGCQRASLESMACNTPVLATNDSKAAEFDGVWSCNPNVDEIREAYITMVQAYQQAPVDLREEFIVGKLDHYTYAKKLKELI